MRRPVGFPGAAGPRIEAAAHLGAGLAAVGAASVGNALRLRGLHPVVISAVQLAEATPRLREGMAGRLGAKAAERTWTAANLLLTTVTLRPLGAAVTAVLAGARYSEVQARRRAWGGLGAQAGCARGDVPP